MPLCPGLFSICRSGSLAIPCSQMPSDQPSGIVDLANGSVDSLFLQKFSLIRLGKFPVPLRREFGCKLLNPPIDQPRELRWMAGFRKIPC